MSDTPANKPWTTSQKISMGLLAIMAMSISASAMTNTAIAWMNYDGHTHAECTTTAQPN